MHIAIIGTRGIPNYYGVFEQCAQYLALGLVQNGFEVTVYNSHNHSFQESLFQGVNIIHCYDPEHKLGTIGQFLYDLNCIVDTRKRKYDIILQLGYTSNSIWHFLLPLKSIITTNMDGLEWKRSKYSKYTQQFLRYAEKLAVHHSDYLIADSLGIKDYLFLKYKKVSTFIPYGAHLFNTPDKSVLSPYSVTPFNYNLLIARLEPENSIELILDGIVRSKSNDAFLVIGKHETFYGGKLKLKYEAIPNIKFIGSIYDINILNNLRHYSNIYFHGHTVGGTNPSLLEAMASNALICANANPFNQHILGVDAYYFDNSDDIAKLVNENPRRNYDHKVEKFIQNNRDKIQDLYTWERIIELYMEHFNEITCK